MRTLLITTFLFGQINTQNTTQTSNTIKTTDTPPICETLDPPKNLLLPFIPPETEIRPPYKLSITTRDYQRIRYWQTTRSSVLVPCILPGANLLLKLEGMLPFQWFIIQEDSNSGSFKNTKNVDIKSCKYENDTVVSRKLDLRQRYLIKLAWQANQLSSPVTFTATIVQSQQKFWKNLTLSLFPCKDESEDFIDKQEFIIRMNRKTLGRIENNQCPPQNDFVRMARFLLPGFNYKVGVFRCDNYSVTYNTVYDINNAFDMGVKEVRTPLWPEKLALIFTERWRNRRIPISSDLVFVVESVNVFYNLTTLPDLPRIDVTESMKTINSPEITTVGRTTTRTTLENRQTVPNTEETHILTSSKKLSTRTVVSTKILTKSANLHPFPTSEKTRPNFEQTSFDQKTSSPKNFNLTLLPKHFNNNNKTETFLIYTFLIVLLIFIIVSVLVSYYLIEEEQHEPWSAIFTPNKITPTSISGSSLTSNFAYCNESLPSIPQENINTTKNVSFNRLDLYPPLEYSDVSSSFRSLNSDTSFNYILHITPEYNQDQGYVSSTQL